MDIKIRKAVLNDAEAIVLLAEELGYYQTREQITARMRRISGDPEQNIFIAEENNVLGWLHVALRTPLESSPFVEIVGLVVTETHRGKGAGTRLIQAAEEWTRETGCGFIRVRTNIRREKTREYYRKQGFFSSKVQEVFEREISL